VLLGDHVHPLSIVGSSNSSPTFCCNAEATCPERWASRPDSSRNASKIPNDDGPKRTPNHLTVSGSS
jgi:hypothetical protein